MPLGSRRWGTWKLSAIDVQFSAPDGAGLGGRGGRKGRRERGKLSLLPTKSRLCSRLLWLSKTESGKAFIFRT